MFSQLKTRFICLITGTLLITGAGHAAIRIVAAIPDIGSIASYMGGDKVNVSAIAKSNSNPHSIEVFPSYMAKVSSAEVYLKSGLGLDQWSDAIIDGSRNGKIMIVDCSKGISVLEKLTHVDASMGDVHPFGNPHYWLDPGNGIIIAQNIVEALTKVDPSNSAVYESNLAAFKEECLNKYKQLQEQMKSFEGANIISYHSSWVYFADAFHLNIIEHIEPFPGIPPTGKHLAQLVDLIKKNKVAFILQEQYFSDEAPRFLNRQSGVKVFKCSPSCSDVKPSSFLDHFDEIVNQINKSAGGK